jgi:hypothetical protein
MFKERWGGCLIILSDVHWSILQMPLDCRENRAEQIESRVDTSFQGAVKTLVPRCCPNSFRAVLSHCSRTVQQPNGYIDGKDRNVVGLVSQNGWEIDQFDGSAQRCQINFETDPAATATVCARSPRKGFPCSFSFLQILGRCLARCF